MDCEHFFFNAGISENEVVGCTKFSHCKYTVYDQVGEGTDKSKKGDNLDNQIKPTDICLRSYYIKLTYNANNGC